MVLDLKNQLDDYLSHVIERIDAEQVVGVEPGIEPVDPVPAPALVGVRRRWAYGAAAAAVIVLLIGGIAWLSLSSQPDSVDEPNRATTTTLPASLSTGSLVVTNVIELNHTIPPNWWGTDRIVAAGGAVWVGVDDSNINEPRQPGSLFRLNSTTGDVTDEISLPGGVIDLVADPEALWALVTDDTVVRLDLSTRLITHSIDTTLGIGRSDSNLRSDLIIAANGLWVAGGDGIIGRIDLDSYTIETFRQGNQDGPLPVDMWIGEVDGVLWGLNSHSNILVSVDLTTNEVDLWPVANIGAESSAVLGNGAIWVTPPTSGGFWDFVRFDLASRERTVYTVAGAGMQAIELDGWLWIAAGSEGQLTLFDASSGDVADIPLTNTQLEVSDRSLIATPDGTVWTSNWGDGQLYRIEKQSREITARVEVGEGGQLLAHAEAIWVAAEDGTITRVAAETSPGETVSSFDATALPWRKPTWDASSVHFLGPVDGRHLVAVEISDIVPVPGVLATTDGIEYSDVEPASTLLLESAVGIPSPDATDVIVSADVLWLPRGGPNLYKSKDAIIWETVEFDQDIPVPGLKTELNQPLRRRGETILAAYGSSVFTSLDAGGAFSQLRPFGELPAGRLITVGATDDEFFAVAARGETEVLVARSGDGLMWEVAPESFDLGTHIPPFDEPGSWFSYFQAVSGNDQSLFLITDPAGPHIFQYSRNGEEIRIEEVAALSSERIKEIAPAYDFDEGFIRDLSAHAWDGRFVILREMQDSSTVFVSDDGTNWSYLTRRGYAPVFSDELMFFYDRGSRMGGALPLAEIDLN